MRVRNWLLCILMFIGIAATLRADTVLLSDNFSSENSGIGWAGNYNSFQNWTVTSGYVDLAGYGSWDFLNLTANVIYVESRRVKFSGWHAERRRPNFSLMREPLFCNLIWLVRTEVAAKVGPM